MKYISLVVLFVFYAVIAPADSLPRNAATIWIDVRTANEYETGHLPGARNINFDQIGARIAEITTDRNTPIALYCRSGRRAGFARQSLEKLGFSNVVNAGGINDVLRRAQLEPAVGAERPTK